MRDPGLPELAEGEHYQLAFGFSDPDDFNRVYDLFRVYDVRGRLDRERTFWLRSEPALAPDGEERVALTSLTFDAARTLDPGLGFSDFCSLAMMQARLPALFRQPQPHVRRRRWFGARRPVPAPA